MDFINVKEFAALAAVQDIAAESAVAVALSGGPDSMALAWLLSCQAEQNGGPVVHALTVDHGLRPESGNEARQVGMWVTGWPHVRHTILNLKKNKKDSRIMERAREGRYGKMAAYCKKNKIRYLLLAHHQDDQAETFLFRLAKGSGLDGLAAMRVFQPYDENLTLVRPFLDAPKERLIATCKKNKIPFISDPSNKNPVYARPRLRQAREVLEAEGLTAQRLAVTAGRIGQARTALEYYASETFRVALKERTKKKIVFDFSSLARAPEDTRLRVLLRAVADLVPRKGYGVRLEKMETLVQEMFAASPFRRRTLGGVIFSRNKGDVVMEREK